MSSGLIDAKRKQMQQQRDNNENTYQEIFSPTSSSDNNPFRHDNSNTNEIQSENSENDVNHVAPLEVGAPSQPLPSSPTQDSFALRNNNGISHGNDDGTGKLKYFFKRKLDQSIHFFYKHLENKHNNPSISTTPTANTMSQSQLKLSWALYLSGMIGMSFLNPLCCVLAMKYANPSILAPFSGLTLVWVVLFAGVAVGERASIGQRVACAFIVVGEVMVAIFGDHTNGEDRGVDEVVSICMDM